MLLYVIRGSLNFISRKFALIEPQLLKSKDALGDYCSFKSVASDNSHVAATKTAAAVKGALLPIQQCTSSERYLRESMVVGLRFEWREAKSKLHVMHKVR